MPIVLRKSQLLTGLLVVLAVFIPACHLGHNVGSFYQNSAPKEVDKLKFQITQDGIYQVTKQDLVIAGMVVDSLSINNLLLSQGGEAVPIVIRDDTLLFYGMSSNSRYVSERSYILELGEPGLAMAQTSFFDSSNLPDSEIHQTVHLEENMEYVSEAKLKDNDDVWFWYRLRQQDAFTTEVDLPELAAQEAVLRINLWGFTFDRQVEGDHSVDVLINDHFAGSIVWDGQTYHTAEIELPANSLHDGRNIITIDNRPEGITFLDIMLINWIELEYSPQVLENDNQLIFSMDKGFTNIEMKTKDPLILDISDPWVPEEINNWYMDKSQLILPGSNGMEVIIAAPNSFLSPRIESYRESNWRDDDIQADLIIITSEEFAPSLAPLVQSREAQGLSVKLIAVEDIYDEFGFGHESPESIQNFVTYAQEHWQEPKAKYLLIVGDATIDFLGHLNDVPDNTIPSIIVPVQFSGETISDSRLADTDGDSRPDLAVGRWPVRTTEEVESLVQRTIQYEHGQASARTLFAADGSESQFQTIASELANASVLSPDQVDIIVGPPAKGMTAELNEGSWLATYIGHGSISRWGKEGIFELGSVGDLATNTPPIVLQFTCLTGLFSHPEEVSLSEAMLTHPSGPVLTVAATSLTLSRHQVAFAVELLEQLQDKDVERIGDAFQNAKLSLDIENSNGLREVSDTFALFGDPSTIIIRPKVDRESQAGR